MTKEEQECTQPTLGHCYHDKVDPIRQCCLCKHEYRLDSHFHGCHKVHIECANLKIMEARLLMASARLISGMEKFDKKYYDLCGQWLESLGVEE